MTAGTKVFGVHRVFPGRAGAEAESTVVQASSPMAAAEVVLGRQLVTVGSPRDLRARVWHMQNDYNAVCTYLYEPAPVDTGLRSNRLKDLASTTEVEEQKLHIYVFGIAFVISLAIAALVILR